MTASSGASTTVPAAATAATHHAPEEDFLRPRYDQSTYVGRMKHFISVIDPLTLLATKKDVDNSVALIERYKRGERRGITQEQIWQAVKIKDSVLHPDSGQPIFAPFRFSAFVPVNVPMVVGMLTASTPASTIFWQWMNQSYNVAVNYANRNIGGAEMTPTAIGISYTAAVASSCGIAVGLGKVTDNLLARPNPSLAIKILSRAVPFLAVASAGVLNVGLMRLNECRTGIPIKDSDGVERGISVAAGRKAVTEVAWTRVALPAPILLFPPLIMSFYDRLSIASNKPKWRPFVQVPVITACLWMALPLAIALFPQQSSIHVEKLEEKFKNMKDKEGKKIERFYFNKGL